MATHPDTLAPILDAIPGATARKMFGEYAVYLDGRVIALVCDDQLYLKDLPVSRALLPGTETGLPYPGAKPHLIADVWLDDPETLAAAARALATVVPPPKSRKSR